MKRLFTLVLSLLLVGILGACGEEEASKPIKEDAPKVEAKEKPAPVKKPVGMAQEQKEQLALALMKENMGDSTEITFDQEKKYFTIYPKDEQFAIELANILAGKLPKDDWVYLLESMVFLNKEQEKVLGKGYSIVMLNPMDKTKVIALVSDGKVVYDAFEN